LAHNTPFSLPLHLPPDGVIHDVVSGIAANPRDAGVGIVDTNTGQIHVSLASVTPDHPTLAEEGLGISDIGDAGHLRAFVFASERGKWVFANNSSLNGLGNKMDPELYERVKDALTPKLAPNGFWSQNRLVLGPCP
jgi:hypothetical protein